MSSSKRVLPDKQAELSALLAAEGVVEAGDLEVQEAATLATIRGCLNPTGQKLFVKAMGL